MRVVLHNYLTRDIGRFRATGGARDCGCGCGGKGDCNHAHDDGYSKAELGIDVTYIKGGYGRPKISETRHYTVPSVLVDPRGYAPSSPFVAGELRKQPGHISMVKSGWTAEKAEGYYKREQRDLGKMV